MQRVVLDGVLSAPECSELLYIARCLAVVGYRAAVASATCFEVAAAQPALLVPLLAAREKVREAVEEALGLECGLLVEFTGLISWRPGAGIAFHHDANRSYLRQRHSSAVAYLNTAGVDFSGGAFQFQHGSPAEVLPAAGKVVAYHAQDMHGVQEVAGFGERFTLTLWFTTDPQHNEDPKLLARLAERCRPAPGLPLAMYQLPSGAGDLRLCRLAMMGFALIPTSCQAGHAAGAIAAASSSDGSSSSSSSSQEGALEQEGDGAPVQLAINPQRLSAWLSGEMPGAHVLPASPAAAGGSFLAGQCPCEGRTEAGGAQAANQWQHQEQHTAGEVGGSMLTAIVFPSIGHAVLVLQYWAWRCRRQARPWSLETVCSLHLREHASPEEVTATPDCGWAAQLQLQQLRADVPRGQSAWVTEVLGQVQDAAAGVEQYLGDLRGQYNVVLPEWIQLGAVY